MSEEKKPRRAPRRPASDVKVVRLKLVRIDFWSAIRMGLLIQIGLAIMTIVGFLFLWFVLNSTQAFAGLSGMISSILGLQMSDTLDLAPVMAFALAISVFNTIVGTLLSGLFALIYNAIARLSGGLAVGFTNN